jgi:hypothetical protein
MELNAKSGSIVLPNGVAGPCGNDIVPYRAVKRDPEPME